MYVCVYVYVCMHVKKVPYDLTNCADISYINAYIHAYTKTNIRKLKVL